MRGEGAKEEEPGGGRGKGQLQGVLKYAGGREISGRYADRGGDLGRRKDSGGMAVDPHPPILRLPCLHFKP